MLHFQFVSKTQFSNITVQLQKNPLCLCIGGELFYSLSHFHVPSSMCKSLKNKQKQNPVVPFPGLAVARTSWFTSAASLPFSFTPFLSAGNKICSSIIKRTLPQTCYEGSSACQIYFIVKRFNYTQKIKLLLTQSSWSLKCSSHPFFSRVTPLFFCFLPETHWNLNTDVCFLFLWDYACGLKIKNETKTTWTTKNNIHPRYNIYILCKKLIFQWPKWNML